MSQKQIILFAAGSIASFVAYSIYSKRLEQVRLRQELQAIADDFLEKKKKQPQNAKDLLAESRTNIGKFLEQSAAAMILGAQVFGLPPDDALGASILQLLHEWHQQAYDEIVEKVEYFCKKKTYKVAILEIGPGLGDGIDKIWTKLKDRVDYVHGYEISKSSIKLLNDKFATRIGKKQVRIDYADIGDEKDEVIENTLHENPRGKYDIIYHFNCFYFWDNIDDICGKRLGKLLDDQGWIIGGFQWKGMDVLPTHIFKNQTKSLYIDMMKNSNEFNMDTLEMTDNVGGVENLQIIAIQKK